MILKEHDFKDFKRDRTFNGVCTAVGLVIVTIVFLIVLNS